MVYDIAALGLEVRADGVIIASKALRDFKKAGKEAEEGISRLPSKAKDADQSFRSLASSANELRNVMRMLIANEVVQQMVSYSKDIFNVNMELQSMANTFKAVTGSFSAGGKEMEFIRRESERLGLDFMSAAEGYKTLAAAAKGTVLEGEKARNIFVAVSEASAVLGLSASKTEMALYAVQQMVSKGVVSMEELRRQLGDQVPGAFQIAARSMGLTEREFNKLVESGELFTQDFLPGFVAALREQFKDGVEEASSSSRAELNRFNNAVRDLKKEIGDAGFFEAMTEGLRELARVLADPNMKSNMRELGQFAGTIVSGLAGVAKYANLRSISRTQDSMGELRDQGYLSKEEYDSMYAKQGGWSGIMTSRGGVELMEEQLEVQKKVDALLAKRAADEKERLRLQNPALVAREMEEAAKQEETAAKNRAAALEFEKNSRAESMSSWQKSVEKLNDEQRALNKLNDDYNSKIKTGVQLLVKYGLTKDEATAVSKGGALDLSGFNEEQKAAVEAVKKGFNDAKKYRDEEEKQIHLKAERAAKSMNREADYVAKFTQAAEDKIMELKLRTLEAEEEISGVSKETVKVFKLQVEAAKELNDLREKQAEAGRRGFHSEEMAQAEELSKQLYDLKIGAAKYAAEWEKVLRPMESAARIASTLGVGQEAAEEALRQQRIRQLRENPYMNRSDESRAERDAQIAELDAESARAKRDQLQTAREINSEVALSTGNAQRYYDLQLEILTVQKDLLETNLAMANTEEQKALYSAQLAKAKQKERELTATKNMDVSELSKIGLEKYQSDVFQQTADFYKNMWPNIIEGAADAFTQFADNVVTGNMSMQDSLRSLGQMGLEVLGDLAKELMKLSIKGMLSGAAGGLFGGGGGAAGGLFSAFFQHTGGPAGGSSSVKRSVPVELFNNAPRFHSGGPVLRPDERPIIAQVGERVQSKAEVAAMAKFENKLVSALSGAGQNNGGTRIVNVLDPSLIHEAMASPAGEKVLMNFIKSNSGSVNRALGKRA